MMNKARIAYLLDRYIQAQLTEQENKEFSSILLDPHAEEVMKELLDAQWDNEQKATSLSAEQQARILAAVQQHDPYAAPVITMQKKKIRWIPAAAAALLLLMASLFFLFKQENKNGKKDTVALPVHQIHPGSNKAILTLDNGQRIVLDTAGSGQLAIQGSAVVIKHNDGELVYNANEQPQQEVRYNTLTIPRGGQYKLTLQDGTKVWLNAESYLRFPAAFTGKDRMVELSGEAYFEVAKNAAQPFIVLANNATQVKVLGTHFNVMAYKEEAHIITTLLEGSVNVSAPPPSAQSKILMPGQQALYSSDGILTINDKADIEQAVAWKNGKLFFNNQDIQTIMRQISRWYNVAVEIKGNIKDTYTVNVARDVTIEKLLKYIELSGGVHFTIKGQKIIVTP